MKRLAALIVLPAVFLLVSLSYVHAVSLDDCNQPNISSDKVRDCIDILSQKVNELNNQKNTLASQIAQFDSQIHITQLRISDAQTTLTKLENEINVLGFRIGYVNDSIGKLETLVKERIVATYQESFVSNLELVLSSNDFSDIILRLQYLKQVQENDRRILASLQDTKSNYANQKDDREQKQAQIAQSKKQLEALKSDLDQQKVAKNELLKETQGSEENYQRLLAQARAQLAGFSNFVNSQGGASLLSNQTSCNDWGCYYNQRDDKWGNTLINGSNDCSGPCSVAKVGCLITSVAMVASHKGHKDILPGTIATSSGDNFSVNTAMLKFSINVNGVSINRNRIGSSSGALPGTITDPIIVGISYDGGPLADHFVVLVSGSSGSYKMNDPFTPNGHEIPFTDHYSMGSIVEVDTVSM